MCPRVVFLDTATSRRIDSGVLVCIVGALNGGFRIIQRSAYLSVFSVKPKFARFEVGFDIFYSDPSPL